MIDKNFIIKNYRLITSDIETSNRDILKSILIILPLLLATDYSAYYSTLHYPHLPILNSAIDLIARFILIYFGLNLCVSGTTRTKLAYSGLLLASCSILLIYGQIMTWLPILSAQYLGFSSVHLMLILTIGMYFILYWAPIIFLATASYSLDRLGAKKAGASNGKRLEKLIATLTVIGPILFIGMTYLWGSQYIYQFISGKNVTIETADYFLYYVIQSPYHLIFKPMIVFYFFMCLKNLNYTLND